MAMRTIQIEEVLFGACRAAALCVTLNEERAKCFLDFSKTAADAEVDRKKIAPLEN